MPNKMHKCDEENHKRSESPRYIHGGTRRIGRWLRHLRAGKTIFVTLACLEQLRRVVACHVEVREHRRVAVRGLIVDVLREGARKNNEGRATGRRVRVCAVAHTRHHRVVLGPEVYWACCTSTNTSSPQHCMK